MNEGGGWWGGEGLPRPIARVAVDGGIGEEIAYMGTLTARYNFFLLQEWEMWTLQPIDIEKYSLQLWHSTLPLSTNPHAEQTKEKKKHHLMNPDSHRLEYKTKPPSLQTPFQNLNN